MNGRNGRWVSLQWLIGSLLFFLKENMQLFNKKETQSICLSGVITQALIAEPGHRLAPLLEHRFCSICVDSTYDEPSL